ncbi:MAG TPA: SPASM domain-containing protein, partial [Candidatus Eisenbacteria bacterium]|nr:SPASM domain-containing protein [Candidatus Eisenbacteria bacterium]
AETDPKIRTYSGGAGGCPAGTHYMGIRPNGDVTPCPYLPVFAGNLRRAALADLWTSSALFSDIRRRSDLGGRCGACEMNGHCGGCRARAYGMTGDLMAEDPLCTHTPGKFVGSPLLALRDADRVGLPSSVRGFGHSTSSGRLIEYGGESLPTIAWDDAAAERMKKVPAFVRGMVVRAVEESCRKSGLDRVTVEELERIRARMPTPKMFG